MEKYTRENRKEKNRGKSENMHDFVRGRKKKLCRMLQRTRVKFVETSEKEKPVQNALTLSAEAVMIKVSKLISSKGFRFRNQISQTK